MINAAIVEIVQMASKTDPPSTRVEYIIRNNSAAAIWVVNDNWLAWSQTGKTIELSFKRERMRKGSQVFGYFPPAVVRVDPGGSMRAAVDLTWPQRLDRLWNSTSTAAPPPGEYDVRVRIGYGLTPEPEKLRPGESVEEPIFRWQEEAISPASTMEIPAYAAFPDG